jgi:lantibiotic biosynthesis protein
MPSWIPLLEGSARDRALAVVHELAAAIGHCVGESDPSLSGGRAGFAILFGYLDQIDSKREYGELSGRCLESAFEDAAKPGGHGGLYSGIAGIGFAVQHLAGEFDVDDGEGEDPLEPVDESIAQRVSNPALEGEYDLINGWVGLGVYALERLHVPRLRASLADIVRKLERMSEQVEHGITWHHDVALVPEWQRRQFPQGWYNLGLAHGMPGVIALLAEAYRFDVERETCGRLLDGSVAWLLKQRCPGGFPGQIAPGVHAHPSRAAWCYGEPGVALALLNAARAMGRPEWEKVAHELMLGVTKRSEESLGVVDTGLCHGAAGMAHLFNRFFQASGDPAYEAFAREWLDRTLKMRQPGVPIAGFPSYHPGLPGHPASNPWTAEAGLLNGACGVGLGLLAACTDIEPRWDRFMLASLPLRDEAVSAA